MTFLQITVKCDLITAKTLDRIQRKYIIVFICDNWWSKLIYGSRYLYYISVIFSVNRTGYILMFSVNRT